MIMPKARGIIRKVARARKRVEELIQRETDRTNRFSGGLSGEGWNGGYRQALDDVMLALNGVEPSTRGFWTEESSK
jgi:hypothetical protein